MSRFLGMLSVALMLAGCGLIADDDERYTMATEAMAPTLLLHQRVTVRHGDEPHRGEIVVFRPPAGWAPGGNKVSISRVIGIGGDELACCDVAGGVVLNRQPLDEPYLGTNSPLEAVVGTDCGGRRFEPVKVPAGELFLMGDNRLVSRDSRCAGTVPANDVIGVVETAGIGMRRVATVSAAAPTDAAGFFTLFQDRNDGVWSGGDQVTSFRASNGLTYWSFGDTVLGEEDPATGAYRPGWTMIANTILVQRTGGLEAATPGSAAVPHASNGDRYWTQGMFEAGGRLYVLCQRVRNTADFFELRGVELARFGFRPDGTLAFQGMVPTPSTGKIGGNDVSTAQYAADAVVTGGYVYVFGYANAPGDPYAPHRSYVARVPVGSVELPSAWRFRSTRSGGSWRAGIENASPILSAQISSVRLIGGRWVLAYKPWNGWGDTVYIERRTTPYGAPTATVTFSSPAGTTPGGQAYQTYSAQLHPEQALSSGRLLVSIAWNGQTLDDLAADADLYKPRFTEVTLPG